MKRNGISNQFMPFVMVYFTIMALLFVQTLPLHSHSPHDHSHPHLAGDTPHHHHAEIHIMPSDASDHIHGPDTEIDLSTDVLVKDIKPIDNLFVAIIFTIVLFAILLVGNRYRAIFLTSSFTSSGINFRPPPRAPPRSHS